MGYFDVHTRACSQEVEDTSTTHDLQREVEDLREQLADAVESAAAVALSEEEEEPAPVVSNPMRAQPPGYEHFEGAQDEDGKSESSHDAHVDALQDELLEVRVAMAMPVSNGTHAPSLALCFFVLFWLAQGPPPPPRRRRPPRHSWCVVPTHSNSRPNAAKPQPNWVNSRRG